MENPELPPHQAEEDLLALRQKIIALKEYDAGLGSIQLARVNPSEVSAAALKSFTELDTAMTAAGVADWWKISQSREALIGFRLSVGDDTIQLYAELVRLSQGFTQQLQTEAGESSRELLKAMQNRLTPIMAVLQMPKQQVENT